jgi:RNA polymerase sigma-70 factor (ECF subfamily)
MDSEHKYPELVRRAQRGEQQSMERLAQLAGPRLLIYIYRLTLDYDLAQDLLQETLLEMVESLNGLRDAGQFWSWLFRTAQGKAQHHFRDNRNTRTVQISALDKERVERNCEGDNDGLTELIRKELSDAISQAMAELRFRHRSVLLLRCFEQMPYSQIAQIMGCKECHARALFFRAKRSLKRQLSRQGFGKGFLLIALALFGRITTPAEASSAAATVTTAGTKVGLIGTIIGAAGTALGIAVITAITAATITMGTIAAIGGGHVPKRSEVKSSYYGLLNRNSPNDPNARPHPGDSFWEHWSYFPEGIDGPMFHRGQFWDTSRQYKRTTWLRNGQGTYCYYGRDRTVYILDYNVRTANLRVQWFPSDPPELPDFLDEVEGKWRGIKRKHDRKTGLLTSGVYRQNKENFRTNVTYNTVDETFFRYPWPSDLPVVDRRDTMHKRGWTYFHVAGTIGADKVEGWGQIPFIYDASKEHHPWLRLRIGNKLEIVDCHSAAYLAVPDGKLIATYPVGSFFKGLGRPWMGIHAVDTVRRDAAEKRIRFSTRESNNKQRAEVTRSTRQVANRSNLLMKLI